MVLTDMAFLPNSYQIPTILSRSAWIRLECVGESKVLNILTFEIKLGLWLTALLLRLLYCYPHLLPCASLDLTVFKLFYSSWSLMTLAAPNTRPTPNPTPPLLSQCKCWSNQNNDNNKDFEKVRIT